MTSAETATARWRPNSLGRAEIVNPQLKALLQSVSATRDHAALRIAPAAKSIHHAFLSGLFRARPQYGAGGPVHGKHYSDNRCLLRYRFDCAAAAPRIGKIQELNICPLFGYSDEAS